MGVRVLTLSFILLLASCSAQRVQRTADVSQSASTCCEGVGPPITANPPVQFPPDSPHGYPGFGRELHLVADQDGDGIRELVIVDSPLGFFVYSLGARRCLRRIPTERQLRLFGRVTATLGSPLDGEYDLVAICRAAASRTEDESSVTDSLVALSTRSGTSRPLWEFDDLAGRYGPHFVLAMASGDDSPKELRLLLSSELPMDPEPDGEWHFETRIHSLPEPDAISVHGGRPVAIVDLDGDGEDDCVVEDAGIVSVHSGRDGAALLSFANRELPDEQYELYGYSPFVDLDEDGRRDLLQMVEWGSYADGTGYALPTGHVRLLPGADGSVLWRTEDIECTGVMWVRAIAVQDRTGDGIPEVVATYSSEVTGFGECPGWRVYDGATGETLREFDWEDWCRDIALVKGYDVLELDDLDGDGTREIAISKSGYPGHFCRSGEVDVYSIEKGLLFRIRRHEVMRQLARDATTNEEPDDR